MNPSLEPVLADLGLFTAQERVRSPLLDQAWPALIELGQNRVKNHGRISEWTEVLTQMPPALDRIVHLNEDAPRVVSSGGSPRLEEGLRKLGPWKKGPFDVFGTRIDGEWQCQMKWQRVLGIASPLKDRNVLDVGTGNGYFLLRAAGEGARFVLGLEPSIHYVSQFLGLQRYFRCPNIALLPATDEEFVQENAAFDTVFSMGVLYHRRSPLDHLQSLRGCLKSGGELVLETIVVDGPLGYSLVPEGRYAQMRNVFFLPSVPTLESWLRRIGMKQIRSSAATITGPVEQRATSWTGQPSLSDFLDPSDPNRTIEGHPAPRRVIVVAEAP